MGLDYYDQKQINNRHAYVLTPVGGPYRAIMIYPAWYMAGPATTCGLIMLMLNGVK